MATTVRSTGVASASGRWTSMSDAEPRDERARGPLLLGPVGCDPSRVRAYPRLQRQVVHGAELDDEPEVLVDEAQPVVAVGRLPESSNGSPSSHATRAGVGRVVAGERLDQRRLAGAVLADERVDLAGRDLERRRRAARACRRRSWTAARGAARAAAPAGCVSGAAIAASISLSIPLLQASRDDPGFRTTGFPELTSAVVIVATLTSRSQVTFHRCIGARVGAH